MKRIGTPALMVLLLLWLPSYGQPLSLMESKDSTFTVLKFDDFYRMVLQNHPVVKQAELLPRSAAQELRLARGGFDPKLEGTWDFKDFKGKEYYNLLDASLKVPVWFPAEAKLGIQQNRGTYLNPENYISDKTDNRQVYAGLSVAIGQGLFIDDRRATVRQAQLMQEMAEAEQVKAINKILLTAAKDYWSWYYADNHYRLMERGTTIAQDLFDRAKMGFRYGEVAAIDTVQAKITLLSQMTALQQAGIERVRAALTLSNHLWDEEGVPQELKDQVRPDDLPMAVFEKGLLQELLALAKENHPELLKLRLKNETLLVQRSLARENLKPRLNLSYYLLDQPIAPGSGGGNEITIGDDYKLGLDFSIPLFLRKERAKLNRTKLKITENTLQMEYAERKIVNAISAQFNTLVNTGSILEQQQAMVNHYEALMEAERLNLENGESDLFKINIQMEKLLQARSKLLKLQAGYQKNLALLYWEAGVAQLEGIGR